MRLKVALIGAGRRAQQSHLKVLNQLRKDRIDFTAVCDINPDTVEPISRQYKVNGYTNIREMTAKEKIDVCIVTVPADAHHSVSCYLSQQGIHHLVETPIAPYVDLAKLMIETAHKHQVKLEISENFPYMPVELMTMEVIRAGIIGKVGRVYRLFSTTGYHGISVINERAGGKPVKVHSLQHVYPVEPYVDTMQRKYDKEGLEFGAIHYDNGAMGIFMCGNKNSALGRNKLVGFEVDGSRGVIVTNGNQGSLGGEEVRFAPDEELARGGGTKSAFYEREYQEMEGEKVIQRMWVDLPDGRTIQWHNPFARYAIPEILVSVAYMQESIFQAVEHNNTLLYTPERALTDMEIGVAMRHSIGLDGAGVALPVTIRDDDKQKMRQSFLEKYGKDPYDIEGLIDVNFPRL